MAVRIKDVDPGSPAHAAGLCGGMRLVSIGGQAINDGLDYEFHSAGAVLRLVVEQGGETRTITVQKQEYQPLGCVFGSYLIDRQHACKNHCVFCFVDQLPSGMRSSLYFKDDDERLGFLFGNYITLTNLSEREVERIIQMRFSPVNISVHTAAPQLRCEMMGNKNAGQCLDVIPGLAKAGIEMNFQLVLCPGVNDGDALRQSIEWLALFYPAARSIAAVPVGLTKHRQKLAHLRPYTAETAAAQLDILLEYGRRIAAQNPEGLRLVYPSDEWFLLCGRPLPDADFYDGYPQLENGVGMWRLFHDEFCEEMDALPDVLPPAQADVVAGRLAAPLMLELAERLSRRWPHVALHVHGVDNDFFGRGVTVTGLLTGGDIMAQLAGKLKTARLLLPEDVLRAEGDVLLDDVSPQQIGKALGAKAEVVPRGARGLLHTLLGVEPAD